MSNVVELKSRVPAMTDQAIENVRALESQLMTLPQVAIKTHHVLHGGVYSRTIMIPAGVMLTGALIKVPTTLTVSGDVTVYIGEQSVHLAGYNVIAGSANRKQAFIAHGDTMLTMAFATDAKTIGEAEAQFTDEADILMSRHPNAINETIITGE